MSENKGAIPAPTINVTPLIDVLLVLLIIFMVAAPLKPHRFMTKLPAIPHNNPRIDPSDYTLVLRSNPIERLKLNSLSDMGTVDDLSPLVSKLKSVFEERLRNRALSIGISCRVWIFPESQRVEKTVFIKAPRSIPYGEVARVLDGLKGTGADPIGSATRRSEIGLLFVNPSNNPVDILSNVTCNAFTAAHICGLRPCICSQNEL